MTWPAWMKGVGEAVQSFGTGIAALGAFILGWINKGKIREVHLTMNSRLDQLLEASAKMAHDKGRREGIESEQQRMRPADPAPPGEAR